MATMDDINRLFDELPDKILDANASGDTAGAKAMRLVLKELQPIVLTAAIGDFRSATAKFANISGALVKAMDSLSDAASKKRLQDIFDKFGAIHGQVSDGEAEIKTWENGGEIGDAPEDEAKDPPGGGIIVVDEKDEPEPPLEDPKPLKSKDFVRLADEYVTFFRRAAFRSDTAKAEAGRFAKIAKDNKDIYQKVGEPLGVPWWFVATLHMLEASFNFNTHLHNGDPLKAKTKQVPKGRPSSGTAPFSWEESARDALTFEKLDGLKDWCECY